MKSDRFPSNLPAVIGSGARQTMLAAGFNLTGMAGIEILEYLKRGGHLKLAPVIVLPSPGDETETKRCYDHCCKNNITKSAGYDRFAAAIRQLGVYFSVIKVPDLSNA